jgi:peptide chain release factor 2
MDNNLNIEQKLQSIENEMQAADFWNNKENADNKIKEYANLKKELANKKKLDSREAIVTIYAGAGGDDAENWVEMLLHMYSAYCTNNKYETTVVNTNKTSVGYRYVTFYIKNNNAYGKLKHESGVHRLVRLSPFNSKGTRETSFAMVEVLPVVENDLSSVDPKDIQIEFTKSSGPGGQNVNKRETAVRITHTPTGLTTIVSSERSQEQNREIAMRMILGKLHILKEKNSQKSIDELRVSNKLDNEWGNHMRSYVLHPYKQIKDNRTGLEIKDVDSVLNDGYIEDFIEAMSSVC